MTDLFRARNRPIRHVALAAAAVLATSVTVAVSGAAPALAYTAPKPRPTTIAMGAAHALALTPSGTVRAWGYNGYGEVGTNSTASTVKVPTTVVGTSGSGALTQVVQVAAGYETSAALRANGTAVMWGFNGGGQLGNNSTTNSSKPVPVVSTSGTGVLTGLVQIATSTTFTIALRSNGTVYAWGSNAVGQLGIGTSTSGANSVPVQVKGPGGSGVLDHVASISVGGNTAYAVRSDGTVVSWGYNYEGQLGVSRADTGTQPTSDLAPNIVLNHDASGPLTGVVAVAGGADFAIALLSTGDAVGWGGTADGQTGTGYTTSTGLLLPYPVYGLHSLASISAGASSYIGQAVTSAGAVFTWGVGSYNQLGDGTTGSSNPIAHRVSQLGSGSGAIQTSAGQYDAMALTSSGSVWTWGYNAVDGVGDGTEIDSPYPTHPTAPGTIGLPKLFTLTAPKLTGTLRTGHTLAVSHGTWGLSATSYTYQWLRNGKGIGGATKSTYKLVAADRLHRISVRVGAARSGYPSGSYTTSSHLIAR